MLKYEKVSRTVWNKLKKAIEKDLDLKLEKEDSGKFTAFKYVSVEYVYDSKEKSLSIKLPDMRSLTFSRSILTLEPIFVRFTVCGMSYQLL